MYLHILIMCITFKKCVSQDYLPLDHYDDMENLDKNKKLGPGGPDGPNDAKPITWTPDPAAKKTPKRLRTREKFEDPCEEGYKYCLRGYMTGLVCGRTLNFHYKTFKNYCEMDFINCIERHEEFHLFTMGQCIEVPNLPIFRDYGWYQTRYDHFLDQTYVYEYDT